MSPLDNPSCDSWEPPYSYLEQHFYKGWQCKTKKLGPLYELHHNYRVLHNPLLLHTPNGKPYFYIDFVNLASLVAVEIDGQEFHSSPEKQQRDSDRQAFLESLGFVFIRFTGKQVNSKAWLCCLQVKELIESRLN